MIITVITYYMVCNDPNKIPLKHNTATAITARTKSKQNGKKEKPREGRRIHQIKMIRGRILVHAFAVALRFYILSVLVEILFVKRKMKNEEEKEKEGEGEREEENMKTNAY